MKNSRRDGVTVKEETPPAKWPAVGRDITGGPECRSACLGHGGRNVVYSLKGDHTIREVN